MDKTDERRKSVGKKSSESNVHAEVTKSDKQKLVFTQSIMSKKMSNSIISPPSPTPRATLKAKYTSQA